MNYTPTDRDEEHAEWLLVSEKLIRAHIGERRFKRLLKQVAIMNQTDDWAIRNHAAFEIKWMLELWCKLRRKGRLL